MEIDMKDIIITKAKDIGFADIKFTKITPLDQEFSSFENWLSEKRHANMLYLERNKQLRNDPKQILPSAKTMIVTATNYYSPYHHSEKASYGKISRYAWGADYHKVIKKMLKKLVNAIKEIEPEAESRYFVDSGPVLEKQWAVRSGMGWQGKNGLIIHPQLGTWFFLGVILSSLEIPPDTSFTKDLCKECTICIDSCPTKAIISPKVIDANKCIAYHTIESASENEIPEEISENLNSWLYGCDICQNVCPWNSKAKPSNINEFYPDSNSIEFLLDGVLSMNEDEFNTKFANSPVKRIGLKKLQRNALALKK
jgi:epoxyqueuosine reductase